MNRDKVIELILTAAKDNRLTCEQAHDLASGQNISLRDIGALCDELNIKITSCQLGCF